MLQKQTRKRELCVQQDQRKVHVALKIVHALEAPPQMSSLNNAWGNKYDIALKRHLLSPNWGSSTWILPAFVRCLDVWVAH